MGHEPETSHPPRSGEAATARALSGWGRHPVVRGIERRSEDLLAAARGAALSRGLGRAYGDAALPPAPGRPLAGTVRADRLLQFDAETGELRAEAGLSLRELNRIFLPRGWFPPVTPGTQEVTLGGMAAADVHGKNHHVAGTFGAHVRGLKLLTAGGEVREIGPDRDADLFYATLGGMGLTGHILEVCFRMERVPSPWIWVESERATDLCQLLEALERASAAWPMTVAWLDTAARGPRLGRGVVQRGRWAEPGEAPARFPAPRRALRVPVTPPFGLLDSATIRLLNAGYYRLQRDRSGHPVHPERFFYPLDAIRDWNRVYGPRGFTQYQCVLPRSEEVWRGFLERFRALGGASFVTVLKDFGDEGRGLLSFPKRGLTIALDVPIRPRHATRRLVDGLNELVIEHGGRVYLAKDALTRPEHYRAMEPRFEKWDAVRRAHDPRGQIASALSVRLFGDAP